MGARGAAVLAGLIGTLLWMPQPARASSLASQLDNLFGEGGITLDVRPINPAFPPHTAHFRSASLQQLGVLTSNLSAAASDFPAVSTVPGFTYQYDEKLQVFTPVAGTLGSIFVERPETLGQGKFEFGLSYAYVSFKQLNGTDLDKLDFTLHHNDCCGGPNTPDFPAFEDDSIDVNFQKFDLTSNVIDLSGTYGVTPRLDVNLLLPIVYTEMNVRAQATIHNTTVPPVHFFDNATQRITEESSVDDNHFGVGDLQLRSKYRLDPIAGFGTAVGLTFQFPTGSRGQLPRVRRFHPGAVLRDGSRFRLDQRACEHGLPDRSGDSRPDPRALRRRRRLAGAPARRHHHRRHRQLEPQLGG